MADVVTVFSLVASHQHLDLDTVARLSAGATGVGPALPGSGAAGAVVLATCNRVEIYAEADESGVEAAREGRDFTEAAHDLGVAVAGVHAALAESLPGRPGTPRDAATARVVWRRRLAIASSEAPAVASRRAAIDALYDFAVQRQWPRLQRIHGDLHLGQVLAVPNGGWRLVDFEGEPLRPMTERDEPDIPLRDVAGMLRSFDYAGAVGGGADPAAWALACREAFLAAYRGIPGAADIDDVLLRALVLDKAVYESIYESRNRPDWLPIPLAGIDAALS